MIIDNTRVSSAGHSPDVPDGSSHRRLLRERSIPKKKSGRTAIDRPELGRALDQLRAGDQLVITRPDRLARSIGDPHGLVEQITRLAPLSAAFSRSASIRPPAPVS